MIGYPCAVCGKEVKKPKMWVETQYSGFYPIGSCCARKFKGNIYVEDEKTKQLKLKKVV